MSKYLYAQSMYFGNRIHISEAESGDNGYICPFCYGKMIAKKGNIKEHHFAHENTRKCDEWYGNKGDWHIEMQDLFPKECQEVILTVGQEKHIADVCIQKACGQRLVIEFQDSPLSYEEFKKRTEFWRTNNSEVIWVFNLIGKDIREIPGNCSETSEKFQWYRAFTTLGSTLSNEYTVFFYMNPYTNTAFSKLNSWSIQKLRIIKPQRTDPYLLRLKGVGLYIPDAIDDVGNYFVYQLDGYAGFEGEKCRNFLQFVETRKNTYFKNPKRLIGIHIIVNIFRDYYYNTYIRHMRAVNKNHGAETYPESWKINTYVHSVSDGHSTHYVYYHPDMNRFVKTLKDFFGEENVVVVD